MSDSLNSKEALTDFYFTFPLISPLSLAYMKVSAKDELDARVKMRAMYGKCIWAFIYNKEQILEQIPQYNLYEIPFGYMPESYKRDFE